MSDIDYDLRACLEYNPQEGFTVEDIRQVLAVWEGENDGDDWRWVLRLMNGLNVCLIGGCDYTGWDCQSSASSSFHSTAIGAADAARLDWLGRPRNDVHQSLIRQIEEGKAETWRERMDKELGVDSDPSSPGVYTGPTPPMLDDADATGEQSEE